MDDGNVEDVAAVIKTTLKERQIVLLSASVSGEAKAKAAAMMKADAVDLEAKSGGIVPKGIHHYYISLRTEKNSPISVKFSQAKSRRSAWFSSITPENIEVTVDKLNYHGIKAAGIYGQASKQERKNAMDGFREGEFMYSLPPISARGLISRALRISSIWMFRGAHALSPSCRPLRQKGHGRHCHHHCHPYERKWIHRYEKHGVCNLSRREMAFGKLVDSQKTKKDIIADQKKKPVVEDKWVEGDGWGEFDDLEDFGEFVIETGGAPQKSKKKKAKEQPFSMAKTPKSRAKRAKKTKQTDDSLGFLPEKRKNLRKKRQTVKKSEK